MASPYPIDLSTCDNEPIHVIGAIQPHGCLIAIDIHSLTIEYASNNTEKLLGRPPAALLGMPAAAVLGALNTAQLTRRAQPPSPPELIKPWFIDLAGDDDAMVKVECLPHRHEGFYVLEFVRPESGPDRVWEEDLLRQRIISELIKPGTMHDLAQVSADIVRDVTGFDRVMIYRFAEDKHGEVIAESTAREDSFLGLHYPASDIPDPARRHFLLNLIRTIPDINAPPVPILARSGAIADAASTAPLDLTYSKLRGVAPVHIEYLNNMGVLGSMSISLTANDSLWGLVACHHYSPMLISSSRLRFAELLGGTISALLQSLENTLQLRQAIRAERAAFDIELRARSGQPLERVINDFVPTLLDLVDARGIVLKLGAVTQSYGDVPQLAHDYEPLVQSLVDGVASSDNMPGTAAHSSIGAGAAYLELSDDGQDYLVFVREEYEHTIKWAGRPHKVEQRQEDGTVRLTPRGSFALWREERRGRSKPFSDSDREVLRITRRALFALNSLDHERRALAAQKEAEDEEARLRLALLDAARQSSLGELASALAHELNQPLSAVSNYVNACRQELRNYGIAIPAKVNELIEDAANESTRAADLVRRLRNFIAQGELVGDMIDLHQVIRQGVELALAASQDSVPEVELVFAADIPLVWADPVQIGQVILNLVRNSVTAMQQQLERKLTITTRLDSRLIEVVVRDSGVGIAAEIADSLFEPFHSSTTSGMGIGLSLCRSIIEAHKGRIASRPCADGAEIIFTLPRDQGERDATA